MLFAIAIWNDAERRGFHDCIACARIQFLAIEPAPALSDVRANLAEYRRRDMPQQRNCQFGGRDAGALCPLMRRRDDQPRRSSDVETRSDLTSMLRARLFNESQANLVLYQRFDNVLGVSTDQ